MPAGRRKMIIMSQHAQKTLALRALMNPSNEKQKSIVALLVV